MSQCPLSIEGGPLQIDVASDSCQVYCRAKQDSGSVSGTNAFEDDYEHNKGCQHTRLEFVSQKVAKVGRGALRQYVVSFKCLQCNLVLADEQGYQFECKT